MSRFEVPSWQNTFEGETIRDATRFHCFIFFCIVWRCRSKTLVLFYIFFFSIYIYFDASFLVLAFFFFFPFDSSFDREFFFFFFLKKERFAGILSLMKSGIVDMQKFVLILFSLLFNTTFTQHETTFCQMIVKEKKEKKALKSE